MSAPRISLVIPAYNEGKYIGDCLEYAIKNTCGRLHEIIVVDNASSDNTAEIARSFAGVRVVKEEKKGLTRARQRGFLEATGDVLAYIDADTRMPPHWLDVVEKEFTLHKNLASLSGPYIYYDISRWRQFLVTYGWWYIGAYPLYIMIGYMLVGGNFAIRRGVLEKMGGFDTSIEFYGEDTNIARRASRFGKAKFKPSFVMYTSARRIHGEGMIKMAVVYCFSMFYEVFAKKPVSKGYIDIR